MIYMYILCSSQPYYFCHCGFLIHCNLLDIRGEDGTYEIDFVSLDTF